MPTCASVGGLIPGGTELFYHETGEFVTRTGALFSFSVHRERRHKVTRDNVYISYKAGTLTPSPPPPLLWRAQGSVTR